MANGPIQQRELMKKIVSIYPDTDIIICRLTSLFPGINRLIEVCAITEIGKSLRIN
jgi:hypothetical protein